MSLMSFGDILAECLDRGIGNPDRCAWTKKGFARGILSSPDMISRYVNDPRAPIPQPATMAEIRKRLLSMPEHMTDADRDLVEDLLAAWKHQRATGAGPAVAPQDDPAPKESSAPGQGAGGSSDLWDVLLRAIRLRGAEKSPSARWSYGLFMASIATAVALYLEQNFSHLLHAAKPEADLDPQTDDLLQTAKATSRDVDADPTPSANPAGAILPMSEAGSTVLGTHEGDVILGTATDDVAIGLAGQNMFYLGRGDDTAMGGPDADTFIYDLGDGSDTIIEMGGRQEGLAADILIIRGASVDQVTWRRASEDSEDARHDDLLIEFAHHDGQVMIVDGFNLAGPGVVETFVFVERKAPLDLAPGKGLGLDGPFAGKIFEDPDINIFNIDLIFNSDGVIDIFQFNDFEGLGGPMVLIDISTDTLDVV